MRLHYRFREQFSNFMGVGVALGLIAFLLSVMPFLIIISLNTLSEQAKWGWHIPHNFSTYISIFILISSISSSYKFTQKGKKNATS